MAYHSNEVNKCMFLIILTFIEYSIIITPDLRTFAELLLGHEEGKLHIGLS